MRHVEPTKKWSAAVLAVLVAVGTLAVLGSCGGPKDVAAERAHRARNGAATVKIIAAWPWSVRSDGLYWEGMEMALKEVNDASGVLGRTLEIIKEDDRESVNEGRLVAQRLANDADVIAVIGHLNSHVSIPAAAIYEAAGLLMLTPGSTSPELTQNGQQLVFRSVNNDSDIAKQMVEYASSEGYRRVLICYVRNAYGLGLANAFEKFAQESGIHVVDRQSYDPSIGSRAVNFQRIVTQWSDMDFDAVFLAGMAPQAGYLIKQMRLSGIDKPVFGGDALDTPELIHAAGSAANGVVVASVFHPDDPRPEVQRFNQRFESIYGRRPDSWAARGYEAVRLIVDAMEAAGSPAPEDVAAELRSGKSWTSITGSFTFSSKGDVVGKSIVKAVVRDGRFEYLDDNALTRRDD